MEEVYIHDKERLLADIKISLGSYAAERIKFGNTGSGVSADFYSAYSLAHNMVWRWGMGASGFLGDFHGAGDYGWSGNNAPHYISDKTKEALDNDVQQILQTCLKEAENILLREKELFEYFAQELLRKEELEYDEIVEIFKKHGKERPQTILP
jgi:cell division protease FtsH